MITALLTFVKAFVIFFIIIVGILYVVHKLIQRHIDKNL